MIAVIGLGFVGLSTALGFAHKQYKVYGFDLDERKSGLLKQGVVPFHEPHLEEYLKKYKGNNFSICDSMEQALEQAKVIFYCVGTPCKDSGEVDLRIIRKAINSGLKIINKNDYKIIVIKSSVPPSTTQDEIKPLIEKHGFKVGDDIGLANNPEFLREGFAWEDFVNADRIVIGEHDKRSGDFLEKLYKPFSAPIIRVSLSTAEFMKYLSNCLLSTLISFSNDMSMMADKIENIDISAAFKNLYFDKRWTGSPASMTSYVYPGCGFGGYCLPKDVSAISSVVEKKGYEPRLMREVLLVNKKIKEHFVDKIVNTTDKNSCIGILGLAFKPDSDDVRETPAKEIIKRLLAKGFKNIAAYDPIAIDNFKKAYNLPVGYEESLENLVEKSDTIVLITAWDEFKDKKSLLNGKRIIDGRYFL
ncbi:MAG: nucleotide sugar dehydrogenase [Parcubacteria group bacterium]|nr:nucleotide sugar dehydrogenase [Parcubacteria group bacterium]